MAAPIVSSILSGLDSLPPVVKLPVAMGVLIVLDWVRMAGAEAGRLMMGWLKRSIKAQGSRLKRRFNTWWFADGAVSFNTSPSVTAQGLSQFLAQSQTAPLLEVTVDTAAPQAGHFS